MHGTITKGQLILKALVASLDGRNCYEGEMTGPCNAGEIIGRNLAKAIYEEGGKTVIDELIRMGVLK